MSGNKTNFCTLVNGRVGIDTPMKKPHMIPTLIVIRILIFSFGILTVELTKQTANSQKLKLYHMQILEMNTTSNLHNLRAILPFV